MDTGLGLQGEVVRDLPSLQNTGILWLSLLSASADSSWSSLSGHQVFTKVGKAFEFLLVDLLHNGFVYQCEHWLFPRKVLVKVIDVSFGFLWEEKRKP